MCITLDDVSIVSNLVVAGVAIVGLYYLHRTLKETKRTADATLATVQATQRSLEAELLNDFLKEYSTGKMLKFVRTLFDFKEHNSDVAKAYEEQYIAGNDLDLARRRVSHYYQRISRLRKADYVTELFVKTVCAPADEIPKLLREIVIPIEKAHAKNHKKIFNEESLEYLLKIIESR